MFDFAWTEIALIGVVALIAIGPKDMPVAIRAVANMVKKARRMAGEFQTHVDEMVRDANLDEVRSQINEIRNLDIKGTLERAVDSDGSIRKTFADDPFKTTTYTPPPSDTPAATSDLIVAPDGPGETRTLERPTILNESRAEPVVEAAPAFIPPSIASPPVAPAFIPPGVRLTQT